MPQEIINGNTRQWCYDFTWLTETGWGVFSYLVGCENGVRYQWYEFSFGILGSRTYNHIRKCYSQPKQSSGGC